jgi:hypothetical protein
VQRIRAVGRNAQQTGNDGGCGNGESRQSQSKQRGHCRQKMEKDHAKLPEEAEAIMPRSESILAGL